MRLSVLGLAELASDEGIVTNRYKDSVGVWTIGVGHTKAAGSPDPATFTGELSVEQCLALLREDVTKYEGDVNSAVKVAVTQYEFDALVRFHYNTGGIRTATLTKSLNAGLPRLTVAAQFMSWRSPTEIIPRRTREMLLFRDAKYTENPRAGVYYADASGKVQWGKGRSVSILPLIGAEPAPTPPPVVARAIIRRGSKGPLVAEWQGIAGVATDGDFGPKTERATKAWQKARGLVDDGVVGPKTWAAALKT